MPPRTIEGVEELRTLVGQEVGTSDWLQVTQDMIDSFSDVTRDKQWIHVDAPRAASRVALRHDDRARVSHPVAAQPFARPGGARRGRSEDDDQLWIESGAISQSGPRELADSRAQRGESGRRFSRRRADHVARDHRTGKRREAGPGRRMGRPAVPVKCRQAFIVAFDEVIIVLAA